MMWLIPSGFKQGKLDIKKNKDIVGQLLMPRTWHMKEMDKHDIVWAGDNDCYTNNFHPTKFLRWLELAKAYQDRCLFINPPDVVGDAVGTMKLFKDWVPRIKALGYPVSLVLQDGIENMVIPWGDIDAVFVGGTTEWKMSQTVIELLLRVGEKKKHRHIGRVNSVSRIMHFWDFAESFDGTDYVYRPESCAKDYIPKMRARQLQQVFDLDTVEQSVMDLSI